MPCGLNTKNISAMKYANHNSIPCPPNTFPEYCFISRHECLRKYYDTFTWSPSRVANAVPTGPSSSPIIISGSAAVPGGPPATSDSMDC